MRKVNRGPALLFTIISAFLIMLSLTSAWVINEVADQGRFTEKIVIVFEDQDVRDSVASIVLAEVFEDRPLFKQLANDIVLPAVSGILGGDRLTPLIEDAARGFHNVAISSEPEDVTLDVAPLKQIVSVLASVADIQQVSLVEVPDQIVVVQREEIPSLHQAILNFTWVGPLAGFTAIVLLGLVVWGARERFLAIRDMGAALFVISFLYLLLIPYLKSVYLAGLSGAGSRTIIGKFFDVFSADLVSYLTYTLVAGVVIFVVGFLAQRYFDK